MASGMPLPIGPRCIKYLMFIFNILFLVMGICLIATGALIQTTKSSHQGTVRVIIQLPVAVIIIGCIVVFITFFGCCGSCAENECMLIAFIVSMVALFILEIASGIVAYLFYNNIHGIGGEEMMSAMKNSDQLRDTTQIRLDCCGGNGPFDWKEIHENGILSDSCCKETWKSEGNGFCALDIPGSFKETGCLIASKESMKGYERVVGIAFLVVTAVLALGLTFAIYLLRAIKRTRNCEILPSKTDDFEEFQNASVPSCPVE